MKVLLLERIDFKKFFGISLIPTLITFYFAQDINELYYFSILYVATVVYVFMFSEAIFNMTMKYKSEEFKVNNKYIAALFVLKLAILVGAILYSVQALSTRIIIPILNYIIHIFVLGASIKKS